MTFAHYLLLAGLFFPVISLLTSIASAATWYWSRRHSSAVLVPYIGPFLLTCWVILIGKKLWTIPLFWILDLGTVAFTVALPGFIREWWEFSEYTRTMALKGTLANEQVIVTFHKSGRYLMKKSWSRQNGEFGIMSLGELGSFIANGKNFTLESHHGVMRKLLREADGSFTVEESNIDRPEFGNYSLRGWRLQV